MRRTRAGLLLGAVVMSVLCVAYGALALRAQRALEGGLTAEIATLARDLFTVLALPPGYERLGPQGLTAAQMAELRSRLEGVAELGVVSIFRESAPATAIQPDGEEVLVKPLVPYLAVSANYFELVGLEPVEGRLFTAEEEAAGARVCVMGAERPERVGDEHSDPERFMNASYLVVGRLPPIQGDPYPFPRIWRGGFWHRESEVLGGTKTLKYVGNRVVYTPITARAPLPIPPQFDHPTWLVPLVAPEAGQSERARDIVREYMLEVWPGAVLDFGVKGWLAIALEHSAFRVRAYSDTAFSLMLALCVVGTAGFMGLAMARRRRETAVERALGKPRLVVVLEAAVLGAGLALLGTLLGAVVSGLLLGDYLLERLAAGTVMPLLRRLAWIAGLTVAAGSLAGAGAAFWATDAPPVQGLRQAGVVPARRAVDFRLPLAVLAVGLAAATLVCLLVSSRSCVAALSGYLQSVGERVILVEQDLFEAEGPLRMEDLLNSDHAAVLREGLPGWTVVTVSVTSTRVTRPDGTLQAVTAYGVDRPWPEEAGYRLAGGGEMTFVEDRGRPVVYLGCRLAETLFGEEPAVGRELTLPGGVTAVVGGVLEPRPRGVPDRLGDRDECLFAAREVLARASTLTPPATTTEIWVYLPPGVDKEEGEARVRAVVEAMDGGRLGLSAEALVSQVSRLSRLEKDMAGQQVFLAAMALGAAAWLVGLVMLARLADRWREVGLRRAVGAPPRLVALSITGEGVLVCVGGGVLGAALGLLLANAYCQSLGWPMVSVVRAPAEVLAAVVLLGLFVSLPTVRQALGTSPMRALREGDI